MRSHGGGNQRIDLFRGLCLATAGVLVAPGCDAYRSSAVEEPEASEPREPVDPEDPGSDEDRGAGELGPTPVELHGALRVEGSRLVDDSGSAVQLRGVSSMWLNWEDDGYAESPSALRWMRNNWGLSVIRASMGIEPEGAYLSDPQRAEAQVRRIVDNAIAAGVYVIVDWHSHEAISHRDEARAFFSRIAADYGDAPNVLYETFNEPLAVHWTNELKPYHEAVVSSIRDQDPDNVIILGTPQWSQQVDRAAADPLDGDNLMYTLHFYSCTHGSSLRSAAEVALGKDLALFVTEWGATHADGGLDGLLCLQEAAAWHDWMNRHHISWAAWKLDDCEPDSTCLLQPDAPLDGGWTEEFLGGHALFVRAQMQAADQAADEPDSSP